MADNVNMPSGIGGLTRFNVESHSKFKLTPVHVILFIIGVIVFSSILKIFWPIQ